MLTSGWAPPRRMGALVGVLLVATLALMVAQHRWLTQLSAEAQARMQRDLRVGLRRGAERVDLGFTQLALSLSAPRVRDTADLRARWAEWARSEPDLAPLVRTVAADAQTRLLVGDSGGAGVTMLLAVRAAGGEVVLDSGRIAARLPQRIRSSLAAITELRVHVELVHRGPNGRDVVIGGTGRGAGPPDATAPVLTLAGDAPGVFVLPAGEGDARFTGPAVWSTGSADDAPPMAGYALHAWHEAGSLERAATALRRRHLAVAFGLTLLLAASGVLLVAVALRGERLALARAALFSGVAHDVRTPLAVIRAAADNLSAAVVGDAGAAAYGRMIGAEADRLEASVESTLGLARALGGAGTLRRDPVPLADVARDAARVAPDRVRVTIRGAPVVRGDRAALEALVGNLLGNALAYSPAGTPVELEVGSDHETAVVIVRDQGQGVLPGERRAIFAPFRRGAAGRASAHPGAGLGLALARHIATAHGGSLTVGAPTVGAEFQLRLPAAP